MTGSTPPDDQLPAAGLDIAKMPGPWLLARMGKRVLRPGGLELTHRMLDELAIGSEDAVVELAPGLGTSARLVLKNNPASYTGIERNESAAVAVRFILAGANRRCLIGTAANTGLEDASASVVFGEAMLTMQTPAQKKAIVQEALRVLRPGGRYGIHELALAPDDLSDEIKEKVSHDLSSVIHVGARPLTSLEWRSLLESEGFEVRTEAAAPMHLLEPRRLIRDEGLRRVLRILFNVLRTPAARRRILAMRGVFRKHQGVMRAVTFVATKPEQEPVS